MANNVKVSKQLVELSNRAIAAASGFYVLGELDGLHDFHLALAKELAGRGWKISTGTRYQGRDDMRNFMDEVFTHGHVGFFGRRWTEENLRTWLISHSEPETAAFVTDPKNLAALKDSIEAATKTVQATYGDPHAVKYDRKSSLKAVFDTVASKVTKETPETRLVKELLTLKETARKYDDEKDVHATVFRDYVIDALFDKGWPVRDEKGYHTHLAEAFVSMEHTVRWSKTQLSIRLYLQDDNDPPRKYFREPRDYMMAHPGDLTAAIKTASEAIDKELAAGITPKSKDHREMDKPAAQPPAAPKP